MALFLLDTNMLLGFSRKAPWAMQAYAEFGLGKPETTTFTSIICRGEMLALAEKNGWGGKRRSRMETVLGRFPTLDISKREIVDAYARIDAWTHGRNVASPADAPAPKPAAPMKQNDIWIAATAHASKATLLSTDRDFEHLNGIWLDFRHVAQGVWPV